MLVDAGVSSASTTAALRQHRIAAVLELAMERNPTGGNRSGAKAMTHRDALSSNTEDASVNEATIMRLLPWSYKGASHAYTRSQSRSWADNAIVGYWPLPTTRHLTKPRCSAPAAEFRAQGGGNVALCATAASVRAGRRRACSTIRISSATQWVG